MYVCVSECMYVYHTFSIAYRDRTSEATELKLQALEKELLNVGAGHQTCSV